MENETYMKRLKDRLQIEFKKQDRSGVYGYTQRSVAYNSNRIEGSTLTEKQTASMFETGTLYVDDPDMIFRTKDIEEMNGHFKMFNYVMKCMEKPLSEDIIKNMHKNLKEGVFEDRANGYAIGGWKKRANRVSDIQIALPQEVPEKIHQLLEKYHNAEKILKQCLDHNIVPVIIRDIHKAEYNRYLNKAQHEQDYKGLEAYFEKEQKYYQESTIPMIFDFDEL